MKHELYILVLGMFLVSGSIYVTSVNKGLMWLIIIYGGILIMTFAILMVNNYMLEELHKPTKK